MAAFVAIRFLPAALLLLLTLCGIGRAQPVGIFGYSHVWRYHTKAQDLGASWRLPDFDDSSWPSGVGVFATLGEPLLQGATIGTVLPLNDNGTFITNFYFRTTFVFTGTPPIALYATNQIDDGAVIYLNGVEVARFGMPAGSPTANTFATRAMDITAYGPEVAIIPGSSLLPGTNVLAVEVHQGAFNSADVAFGMKLAALPVAHVSITSHPESQLAPAGTMVILSVGAAGTGPLRYQWRKDGNPIANATASAFAIPSVTFAHAGVYSVEVSNLYSAAVSSNALLTVASNVPAFLRTQPSNRTVTVGNAISFSATAGGSPPFQWQWRFDDLPIPFATNSSFTVTNAQTINAGNYSVEVTNLYGLAVSSNVQLVVALPDKSLVPLDYQWRYNQTGENLGSAWRQPEYDDSSWPTGRGGLAFETGLPAALTRTVLSLRNPSGLPITTYYFRTRFTADYPGRAISLVTSNLIDDGAVFYINGMEYARFNMRPGNISHSTLAEGPSIEGVFFTNTIPSELLIDGTNVLAVEVHQASTNSFDVVFGMAVIQQVTPFGPLNVTINGPDSPVFEGQSLRLEAAVSGMFPWTLQWFRNGVAIPGATNRLLVIDAVRVDDGSSLTVAVKEGARTVVSPPTSFTVIAAATPTFDVLSFTQAWRYAEMTTSIGDSWLSPDFDDSPWLLGSGVFASEVSRTSPFPEAVNTFLRIQNDASTYIPSHYFRTWINFPPMLTNAVIFVTNLVDDGAAYFLNESEVDRVRLPAGPLAFNTQAASSPSNGRAYEAKTVNWPFIIGSNGLAVGVHQALLSSSDIAFGMRITALSPVTEPLTLYAELESQTVDEHAPVQFKAGVFGGGPVTYQWYQNGIALPKATNQVFDIPAAHGSFAGEYFFTATNLLNGVASAPATLTILPDQAAPTVVWVGQTNRAGTVWVRFSEAMDAASATNVANYSLADVPILGARMVDDRTVELLIEPVLLPGSASLAVTNVADLAVPPNHLAGAAIPVTPYVYRSSAGLLDVKTFFLISFENHSWSQIFGNPDCPFINNVLLPQSSYANQHYPMVEYPFNEPNYIWMLSGTNFGLWEHAMPTSMRIRSTNHLMNVLDGNGISWKTYQESISGTDCPIYTEGWYVVNHNPFVYFDSVTTNLDYCLSHVRPMSELASDLVAGEVARFNYLTPNAPHAMYFLGDDIDPVDLGDNWLSEIIPLITNSAAYADNGCVIITWDESPVITAPVGLIVLSPLAKGGGYNNDIVYDHRSILRTVQEVFGVYPLLGSIGEVPSFSDLFRDVSIIPVMISGVPGVQVVGVAADSIAWVQASSDLVEWTVIGSVTETESTFVADPGAVGGQRFYRVIGLR